MSLRILHPGYQTQLQDWGRFGHQHLGITTGGPMDEHAYLWGHHLLGNDPRAASLEITLGKLRIRAETTTQIALTGADMGSHIGGRPLANWSTHTLHAGDQLEMQTARSGLRAYLAVRSGFLVPLTMGSCSTVAREGFGGLHGDGESLRPDDVLSCRDAPLRPHRQVPTHYIPDYSAPVTLRVIAGYQHDCFSAEQRQRLLTREYRVTKDSNRMGYRLAGPPIRPGGAHLLSEGLTLGAIQLPPDGQPIILLRDRQTIGGYPKIGTIALRDCSRLAQLKPGDTVRFRLGDINELAEERFQLERFFRLHGHCGS